MDGVKFPGRYQQETRFWGLGLNYMGFQGPGSVIFEDAGMAGEGVQTSGVNFWTLGEDDAGVAGEEDASGVKFTCDVCPMHVCWWSPGTVVGVVGVGGSGVEIGLCVGVVGSIFGLWISVEFWATAMLGCEVAGEFEFQNGCCIFSAIWLVLSCCCVGPSKDPALLFLKGKSNSSKTTCREI